MTYFIIILHTYAVKAKSFPGFMESRWTKKQCRRQKYMHAVWGEKKRGDEDLTVTVLSPKQCWFHTNTKEIKRQQNHTFTHSLRYAVHLLQLVPCTSCTWPDRMRHSRGGRSCLRLLRPWSVVGMLSVMMIGAPPKHIIFRARTRKARTRKYVRLFIHCVSWVSFSGRGVLQCCVASCAWNKRRTKNSLLLEISYAGCIVYQSNGCT